jgi:hypothetical protein
MRGLSDSLSSEEFRKHPMKDKGGITASFQPPVVSLHTFWSTQESMAGRRGEVTLKTINEVGLVL